MNLFDWAITPNSEIICLWLTEAINYLKKINLSIWRVLKTSFVVPNEKTD